MKYIRDIQIGRALWNLRTEQRFSPVQAVGVSAHWLGGRIVSGGIGRMLSTADVVSRAQEAKVVVPAFNVPYRPMIAPIIRAVQDEDSVAPIEVARLE